MHIIPIAEPLQVTDSKIISDNTAAPIVENHYHFGGDSGDRQLAPTTSTPTEPSGFDWVAAFVPVAVSLTLVGLALGLTKLWATTLADLNVERETAAQIELQRLQGCLNN